MNNFRALLFGLWTISCLSTPSYAQLRLSLGSLQGGEISETQLSLGYKVALPTGLSLHPQFGLVGRGDSLSDSIVSPSGYTLGLWGEYDFLSLGASTAYAQGGLSYVDFDAFESGLEAASNGLQVGLGLGADLELSDTVSAFTNVSYLLVNEASEESGGSTGIVIGLELSF